jgi:hypothetical protein
MTAIKRKLPRDPNQRAKSIVDIVAAISEGENPETLGDPQRPEKDPERVARGKLGGAKGGTIRAAKLTPERRSEIARKAAAARWGKPNP